MPSKSRLSLWSLLAMSTAVLAVLTAADSHWIEDTLRIDPDQGNGSLEWIIVVTFAAVAVLSAARVWACVRSMRPSNQQELVSGE